MDEVVLAASIDQTLLQPTVGFGDASIWIDENAERGFATLCVAPFLVPLAARRLAGLPTRVCTVCSFPFGYSLTASKVEEARHLARLGASELDVVANLGALMSGEERYFFEDLKAVVDAVADCEHGVSSDPIVVKVILETCYLDEKQIARGSYLAAEAGAAFVKTSTGFGPRGASVRDIEIIRAAVGPEVGVKASGGIRDLETALAMINAGATRIGTSSGKEILAAIAARV